MVQLMKSDESASRGEKTPVKMEVEDCLEEEHGPLHKRPKQQQQSVGMAGFGVPPSQYNPLDEPSPLGLRLRKSPSLLELIQIKLSHSSVPKLGSPSNSKKESLRGAGASGDKLKASNFPGSVLRIGTWELARQPLFYRETNPQPRKHTLWQATSDFTGGQASLCRIEDCGLQSVWRPPWRQHFLECPQGLLGKHFEKLIQCDPRLNFLSQQGETKLESPYFEPRIPVIDDQSENNNEFDLNREGSPSFFTLQDTASPSGPKTSSSKNDVDVLGRHSESYTRETPSPSSALHDSILEKRHVHEIYHGYEWGYPENKLAEREPVYQFNLSLFLFEIFESRNRLFIVGEWIFRHLRGSGYEGEGFLVIFEEQKGSKRRGRGMAWEGRCGQSSNCGWTGGTLTVEDIKNSRIDQLKELSNWDQVKAPDLHSSMSMSDLVSHLENRISEQGTSDNPTLSSEEWQSLQILDDIKRCLFSESQNFRDSDEKSLMSRVDSLCCLLQKDAPSGSNTQLKRDNSINLSLMQKVEDDESSSDGSLSTEKKAGDSEDVSGPNQVSSMSRKDSVGELLLSLPRIASRPQFFFNISDDYGNQAR
ncbi:hypothetical protein SASPL_118010 [Salvia splendens]|uniref:TRF2/HOY1 PH-like domain-containing protein n=1 Tax=Salvia splendens TaxID=180675 RepID=A0A8X8ZWU9_SALSN|nr:hypothetical protein SASPL_118010 [Salvia splendens]